MAATLLGARFLQLCWVIAKEDGVTPTTWRLYKYSLSYLALLFVAMAVDRWVPFGHRAIQAQEIQLGSATPLTPDAAAASGAHTDH